MTIFNGIDVEVHVPPQSTHALDPFRDAYSSKTLAPVGHHTYNLASFVSIVLGIESNKISHDTQLRCYTMKHNYRTNNYT